MSISPKILVGGSVAVAVVAVGGYLYVQSHSSDGQVIVVHPKEFVQQVNVSGKVVAAHDVDLGFAGSGRVARVYAQVGDMVAAGSVLAEIENGDLRAAVAQREAAVSTQEAKLAALKAGARPEAIAVSQAGVESAQSALDQSEPALLNAIQSVYAVADDAVHNKIDQFLSNPRTQNPQLNFSVSDTQRASTFLNERITIESRLHDWAASVQNLVAPSHSTPGSDLSKAALDAHAALDATAKLLADSNDLLNAAISTTAVPQSTISSWITSIATGRTALQSGITALTSAESAESSARSALTTAQKNLALAQAGATKEDLDAQEAQVQSAQSDVDAAQAQLAKTLITAPFSGIVTKMDAKAGLIASANNPLVSLESRGTFQIESYVPEINISLVTRGQKASVTLDAYGTDTVFDAVVASVDPAETVRDGVSTYRVVLQFVSPDERVKSGMSASVSIIAQKREGVIAVPQGIVTEKDGHAFVQVKEGNASVEREVKTGVVSSLGEVEIISGLSDGDIVVIPATQ